MVIIEKLWRGFWSESFMGFRNYGPRVLSIFMALQILLALVCLPWTVEVLVVWILSSMLLHVIQGNYSENNRDRWLRNFIISGVFITCFNILGVSGLTASLGIFSIVFGVMQLAMLSVRPFEISNMSNVWFENAILVSLMGFWVYEVLKLISTILSQLIIVSNWGMIAVSVVQYATYLTVLASVCVLSGRDLSALFGEKRLSKKRFLQFFLLGIFLSALPLDLLNPFALYSYTTLLFSVNVVSWEALTYLSYQSAAIIMTLMQTLWEEIVFRTILSTVIQSCGYGESAMKEGSDDRMQHIAVMTVILGALFAGVHMMNPAETGRLWLSMLEKFAVYSIFTVFSLAYMVTGNIACSWGWHFAHNFKIGLFRYSNSAMDNGFYHYNLYIDNRPSWVTIGSSMCSMAINMGAFLAVNHCIESDNQIVTKTL